MSTQVQYVSSSKAIAVTGTAVPLSATALWVYACDIFANTGNANKIFIGDSTVVHTGTIKGGWLNASDVYPLGAPDIQGGRAFNLADVYINGTAGEGVSFNYVTGV